MAHTKLYLDMRGKAKDGMGSLLLMIFHKYTTASISLGIRLRPDQWSNDIVVNHADAALLNAIILKNKADYDMRLLLLASRENIESMSAAQLKNLLANYPTKKSAKHLVSDVFADYMSGEMRPNTRELYQITLNKIEAFSGKNTYMEDLDLKWLRKFDRYLSKTLKTNSKAIFLRDLKSVCNYAKRLDIQMPYIFDGFQIKYEPTKKRNVEIDRMREFYRFKCDKFQQRYKDFFFLMLFLCGIAPVDLFNATPDMVYEGRLHFSRIKTRSRMLATKIEPEAQALIDKYKGENYLINVMDTCKYYKNFLHRMDLVLRHIGPVIEEELPAEDLFSKPKVIRTTQPIVPGITAYWARHSWSTYAQHLGFSSDVVGLALGHQTKNKITWTYIEPDQSQIDAANRAVIDYLLLN